MIKKFVTVQFAVWNCSILMLGTMLGTTIGLSEQFLNLLRYNISFCGGNF